MEYGYSCMGYEIAGGLGVKMADPSREVYVMVGDGSFLMMSSEIVTSVQEGYKLNIVLLDNHGFASIGGLSQAIGSEGFGTNYRHRTAKRANSTATICRWISRLCAPAWARARSAPPRARNWKQALEAMRGHDRTTAVVIEVDKEMRVPGYESWWDVAGCRGFRIGSREAGAGSIRGGREARAAARTCRGTGSVTMTPVKHYIGGEWRQPSSEDGAEVRNPAKAEVVGRSPVGSAAEVGAAVDAAAAAFPGWRDTPPPDRIQFLFRLKQLLEAHFDEIATIVTNENGKTLAEARGELRRGVENVEVACGIPTLMQGYNLEDVARGIDESMFRQPLGVVAAITPFNFPAMIPLWFLPYAVACGNTFILKPSERVPFSMLRVMELIEAAGFPKGVVNLVNGGKAAVDALLDHPSVRPSASSDPHRWRATSIRGQPPTANVCNARAARRITWWCFPMRTPKALRRSSPIALMAAPASAVSRCPSRSRSGARASGFRR